jgi:predicted transcriptional regulator
VPSTPARSGVPAPPAEPAGGSETQQLVDRITSELDLLSRNVDILEQLSSNPPMGIIRLGEALHLPIHKVRYSLHLLEREGVIQPSADGAVVTERAKEFWESLDRSLERMNETIRHLKERAAEYNRRSTGPGRKGY